MCVVPLALKWYKIGGSDCLLKTQDSAKFKNDVLSLTLAQCWKVKRRSLKRFEYKLQLTAGCNSNGPKVAEIPCRVSSGPA